MKLQSNTSYGKELTEKYLKGFYNLTDYQKLRSNYDEFLSLPLTLGMFIPTDENGNVLEEPKKVLGLHWQDKKYEKAKANVIFEGFRLELNNTDKSNYSKSIVADGLLHVFWFDSIAQSWRLSSGLKTIEDLEIYLLDINETSVKKYGL